MTKERLSIEQLQNKTSLPSSDQTTNSGERFSDDEMLALKRDFAIRFAQLFPGLRTSEIANRLRSQETTIGNYVRAQRLPTADMLIHISRLTGVNIHWLLTGEGARQADKRQLFTAEEELRILHLAKESGRTFDEMARVLLLAMLEAVEKV